MNSQNNEDSMNFSVIDKPEEAKPCLDFSLQSILEPQPPQQTQSQVEPASLQKSIEQVFSKIKKINVQNSRSVLIKEKGENTFLEALQRMEKELSFQTESYNIYEQNPNFQTQVLQNNKSKTVSCLKTTKETNKSSNPSANQEKNTFNDYYGPLIIDFKKKENKVERNEKSNKLKKSENSKNSNSNSGSLVSSDRSEGIKTKQTKNSKSKSKEDLKSVLGLREKSKSSKNYLLPCDFRKSKSKLNNLQRGISKSHGNLKISGQTDSHSSKVFTEYYGTDLQVKSIIPEQKQTKQQEFNIKSREKSKSKKKLRLLSPRYNGSKTNFRK